jgi:hypothetical protein
MVKDLDGSRRVCRGLDKSLKMTTLNTVAAELKMLLRWMEFGKSDY